MFKLFNVQAQMITISSFGTNHTRFSTKTRIDEGQYIHTIENF